MDRQPPNVENHCIPQTRGGQLFLAHGPHWNLICSILASLSTIKFNFEKMMFFFCLFSKNFKYDWPDVTPGPVALDGQIEHVRNLTQIFT